MLWAVLLILPMAEQGASAAGDMDAVGVITDLAGPVSVRDKYAKRSQAEKGGASYWAIWSAPATRRAPRSR